MGDRVAIAFRNEDRYSEQWYQHWGGRGLVKDAMVYIRELKDSGVDTTRIDPQVCLKDFMKWWGKDYASEVKNCNIYAPYDDSGADDNGFWVIDMDSGYFDA